MSLNHWLGALLVIAGMPFFFLGMLGLLRFPDAYTRLHALAKSDNVALGLVCLGLAVYSDSLITALKLLLIWLLMLVASAAGASLIGRTALARGIKPWGV